MTGAQARPSTPEELFRDSPAGMELYRAAHSLITTTVAASVRTTTSQVAFRRRRGFAYVWNPRRNLKTDVPAVLSIALPRRIDSPRFKEIVHPSANVWMHHLELRTAAELDAEVAEWLTEAYEAAA
ncbi:hypothetical protein QFZ30_001787 [Arthrobacter pascens]|uniref:DUF5655 domain-containing protein n=1 Tax=Arthrobacter pascens TaxID=1677 RepID=UPI00278D9FB2|nr:DUF5655 domain-containing protein [Arthrobacter pascens]MDQ0678405.1 hypothetical protein [Arthrobacter pascens]